MKRTKSWNQEVSDALRKHPKAAGAYLTGLMEADEDLSLEEALKLTISTMGISEYCEIAKVERTNVTNFVSGKREVSAKTLNAYLKPFGLKAELTLKKAG